MQRKSTESIFWYLFCINCENTVILKVKLTGVTSKKGIVYLLIGVSLQIIAQPKQSTRYVDRNYKDVPSIREAAYIIEQSQSEDTVFFQTYNKLPRSIIEAGKYPANQGADEKNCFIQRYWPNGKLRSEGQLKHSWNDGLWIFYDEEGKLYSKINYANGMMNGDATRFYPNGSKRSFNFKNNIKNGESVYSDEEGRLLQISYYENDTLSGAFLEFYKTGNTKRKTLYNNGLKQKDSLFYENGVLLSSEQYNAVGQLHGKQFMYTLRGKMARFDDYNNGNLIQSNCLHPIADSEWEGEDCPTRYTPAQYPGGIAKYFEFVNENTEFPEDAISWKQQGVVEIEFTVDRNGFIDNITQENITPLGFGLEKETFRLISKVKKFEPEQLNGRKMESRYRLPFIYVLQEEQ